MGVTGLLLPFLMLVPMIASSGVGIKAAKLKVLGDARCLNNVAYHAAVVTRAVGLNYHNNFDR